MKSFGILPGKFGTLPYNLVITSFERRFSMKVFKLTETNEFTPGAMKRFFLVETSEFFKIINFNLDAGVTFPVHSHDLDGELSIQVLEGNGWFLGENDARIPANTGDILVSEIREPHGVLADTKMRIIVTIAPPI
jgi:quercetin dioxygenase-like cupin family protein